MRRAALLLNHGRIQYQRSMIASKEISWHTSPHPVAGQIPGRIATSGCPTVLCRSAVIKYTDQILIIPLTRLQHDVIQDLSSPIVRIRDPTINTGAWLPSFASGGDYASSWVVVLWPSLSARLSLPRLPRPSLYHGTPRQQSSPGVIGFCRG